MHKNSKLFYLTAKTNWVLADHLYTGWYDEFSNAVTEYRIKQEKEEGRFQEYLCNLKHVKYDPGSIGQYPLSCDTDSVASGSSTLEEAESHTTTTKRFPLSKTTIKKVYPLRNHRNKVSSLNQSRHVNLSGTQEAKKCNLGSVTLTDVPLSPCVSTAKRSLTQKHMRKKNISNKNQIVKEYPLRKRTLKQRTSSLSTNADGNTMPQVCIDSKYQESDVPTIPEETNDFQSILTDTRSNVDTAACFKHQLHGRRRERKVSALHNQMGISIKKNNNNDDHFSWKKRSISSCQSTRENPCIVDQNHSQLYGNQDVNQQYNLSPLTDETHEVNHQSPKSFEIFKCGICINSYKTQRRLKIHERIHTSCCFTCDDCGTPFSEKYQLDRHMVIHRGLKEHVCDKCDMAFLRKDSLKRHMLTHNSLKPFQCKMCSATFNRKDHFHTHMMSHDGMKPHKCKLCEKQYCRRFDLNLHIRLFHQGWQRPRPYKCRFKNCKKTFTRIGHLNWHHKYIHK